MEKFILAIIVFVVFISSTLHALSPKFTLPIEFPYDYYTEEFWERNARYQEIIPTTLDWLFILVIKKPDAKEFNRYSDEIVYLLDNRKAWSDKRSRMVMIIHTRKGKYFFSATDGSYLKSSKEVSDTPEWEVGKSQDVGNCKVVMREIIKVIEDKQNIIEESL